MEAHGALGVSAVAVCGGEIAEEFYAGLRNVENNWPVTSDTKYRIASVSKSITALGCLKLVEAGLLDLDADVNSYLPFGVINLNHPYIPITLRMLLSHTSSLQDGDGYSGFLTATYQSTGDLPSMGELLELGGTYYTTNMYRAEAPGTYFTYSNLNFGVVATAMEWVTGQRFDHLMDSLIFQPMELTCTYNPSALEQIDELAALYRNQGGWVAQADQFNGISPAPPNLETYVPGSNGLRFAPQGGLRASARDLFALMALFFNEGMSNNGTQIVDSGTLAAMMTPTWTYDGTNGNNYYNLFNSWGLGLQRITNTPMGDLVFPGQPMWGHPGEAYGLVSDWYFNPATQDGVIFLTNGVWSGYSFGDVSAFYTIEEGVFEAAELAIQGCAAHTDGFMEAAPAVPTAGRPGDAWNAAVSMEWFNPLGQTMARTQPMDVIPSLPPGTYLVGAPARGSRAFHFTILP